MVPASATRWPRGLLWLSLSIVLGAAWPLAVRGQAGGPPATKGAAGGAAQPKATPEEKAAAEAEASEKVAQAAEEAEPPTEKAADYYFDPKTQAALANTFEPLFNRGFIRFEQTTIDRLARGQAPTDTAAIPEIERFVQAQAKELTDRANIAALLSQDANPSNAKSQAIEKATERLLEPLLIPTSPANFRTAYTKELLKVMPELVKNHLFARTQGMIVLSKTGDPQALDFFIAQLNDRDQVMMAKLLAAVGITNIVQGGKKPLDANTAIRPAKALADFLEQEPDTFWMAQVRALEALGALRQASGSVLGGQGELAVTALKVLADPKLRPEVRAWAAWALGMMQIPPTGPKINYALVAYHIGLLAAELGALIAEAEPPQSSYLTGLLVYQLYTALHGDPAIRGSGLSNQTGLGPAQSLVKEVENLVGQVATAAIETSRSVGTQLPQRRKALLAKVESLKTMLTKSAPKDLQLVPGGQAFPANVAQVAEGR